MLGKKLLGTLVVVLIAVAAALAADFLGNWILASPKLFTPIFTSVVTAMIAIPLAYYVISQRINAQLVKEELAALLLDNQHALERLRESEARYRELAENATDMIVRYDTNGVIEFASPSFRQLGYEPRDLLGHRAREFTHPEEVWLNEKILSALGEGRQPPVGSENEQRVRCADGTWVWLQASPSPIRDSAGKVIGAVSVLRDVTARRAMEEELRRKQAEAEAATVAKSEFLANMSHEIRTPLTGDARVCRVVGGPGRPASDSQEVRRPDRHSGQALLSVVNDILDFSKLDADKIELDPHPFDLARW